MSIKDTTRFINTDSGAYPLALSDVRRELNTVSLPRLPSLAVLSDLGYEIVQPTAKPQDGDYIEDAPGKDRDGVYHQRWRPASTDATEAETPYFDDRLRRYRLRVDGQRERLLSLGYTADTSEGIYRIPLSIANRQYMTELLQWGLLQSQDSELTARLPCVQTVSFELPVAEVGTVILDALAHVRKIEAATWVLQTELNAASSLDDLMVVYDNSVESEMGRH